MSKETLSEDLVSRLRLAEAEHCRQRSLGSSLLGEAASEIERLRRELAEEKRRSFQGSRISYRGFSYGVGSEHGIDSLRRAIEGNGHG